MMEDTVEQIFNFSVTFCIPVWIVFTAAILLCWLIFWDSCQKHENEEMDIKKTDQWYQVSEEKKLLPRYYYHQYLLNSWLRPGLMKIPNFQEWVLKVSPIIVGGALDEKHREVLFRASLSEVIMNFHDPSKDFRSQDMKNPLIVYFFSDLTIIDGELRKIKNYISFNQGTILFVMKENCINNDKLKQKIAEVARSVGIDSVNFVEDSHSKIIQDITCILETEMYYCLKSIKRNLMSQRSQCVTASLLKVNAFLQRLEKGAKPYLIAKDEKTVFSATGNKELDTLLKRFNEEILYKKYDGHKLYIIAKTKSVKDKLDRILLDFEETIFEISVEDKLPVTKLANRPLHMHGTKFVYKYENAHDFHRDLTYATTGSLMMANGNSMVVITSRHAFEDNQYTPVYTLIGDTMEKLGRQVPQLENNMKYLHDDITIIRVETETRKVVDEKCEKLLIDCYELPSPAIISSGSLEAGDIVHKRGANTGLTTGIVTNVCEQALNPFSQTSTVIFIAGDEGSLFADKGDSGSLVYKQSLSTEENILEVHAMVHGKVPVEHGDIICFPIKNGCDTLKKNIFLLQTLQFCDV